MFAAFVVARFNLAVPDVIEAASSGRAKCRGCGEAIAKGELRFGESLPNPFAEGEALYWFHLHCAASMRPEKFLALRRAGTIDIPDRDWLDKAAEVGAAHRRLPRIRRAERASTGRATCRHCRELIEKGSFRIALQLFEEGRMTPIGYIHVGCSEGYFGFRDVVPRIARLCPGLSEADHAEMQKLLDAAPPADRLAKTRPAEEAAPDAAPVGDTADAKAR
jgi:hypothetical protein